MVDRGLFTGWTVSVSDVAANGRLALVVSLCGTADDPQGLDRQATALAAAADSYVTDDARIAERMGQR